MRPLPVLAFLTIWVIGSSPVAAHQAVPPERPAARRVLVSLLDGAEISGTLLDLSPAAVTLLVDGSRREYRLDDVSSVEARGDSLANGAVIGASVVGVLCVLVCGQGLDDPGDLLGAALVNAGIGALIGTGIDAAHTGRRVLYQRPRPSTSTGQGLRPMLSFRVRF